MNTTPNERSSAPIRVPATVVPLAEAAERTGLADGAGAMRAALVGSVALVTVGEGVGVDLTGLAGEVVDVEVGEVSIVERGVLA